jgi:pimeloyl-ACP methyl ester carboxylesterase
MLLNHRDLGGAGKTPLVILHGLLGSSRNWLTAGAALAGSFHVFALDLRNHGRSPHAAEMTYPAMADDVLAWLDGQGLAQVTLLGHSLGGKVAMRLACRHPERVGRLIVVDIVPRDYPEHADRAEFNAMNALRLETIRSRAEAERAMEPLVPKEGMRKFLTTNLEAGPDGGWRWIVNLPALTAAVPILVMNPLADEDRFAGPTRFIAGGRSRFVAPEDRAIMHKHFPAADLMTIAAAGHNPHLETPDEFLRAVVPLATN